MFITILCTWLSAAGAPGPACSRAHLRMSGRTRQPLVSGESAQGQSDPTHPGRQAGGHVGWGVGDHTRRRRVSAWPHAAV
jgi:hypothetical protein